MRASTAVVRIARGTALLVALLGCGKDTGVVGMLAPTEQSCEPECGAYEQCDSDLGMCVPCEEGSDCAPPDPPDPPADAGPCGDDGEDCPACTEDEQCGEDAPLCLDGDCVQCEENSDCDGSGDLECEDGFCVEAEDEE